MSHWKPIAAVTDCADGEGRECVIDGRIIALFLVDGEFFAIDGICPHQGGPLAKGAVAGCVVTCPWHGWQYDVTSGKHMSLPSVAQTRYELKVEQGQVWAKLCDPPQSQTS